MTETFLSTVRCASLLQVARALREADVRCNNIGIFIDGASIVVRCDHVDVVRLSHRDYIDAVLNENDRLIPALTALFGGMVQARTASLWVSCGRRHTATIIGMYDDDRHRYVNRNGLHVAASIADDVGFGRSDVVLYDRGAIAIAFRSSKTPGSIVVASYVEPGFESNPDIPGRAVDVRIAIEKATGDILANNADFRRLAIERCPTYVDVGIVETLVFPNMAETIYALLPGSNIVDVISGKDVRLVPPFIVVNIDGEADWADWADAAGLATARADDDIAIALMPRDAERWRVPGEAPTLKATSILRTVADGMQCIIAEASHMPFVEVRNGRAVRFDVAPLQGVGAFILGGRNACVLVAPSFDDIRRASFESIERATALALAQSPSDIGAALHGYATSIDIDRIVNAFRSAII